MEVGQRIETRVEQLHEIVDFAVLCIECCLGLCGRTACQVLQILLCGEKIKRGRGSKHGELEEKFQMDSGFVKH